MKLKFSLPHSWRATSQWTAARYCLMTSQWCCALQFHRDSSHSILRGGIIAWAVLPACWWLTGMKDKIEKYSASDSPRYLQTLSVSLQSLPWWSQPCLISHLSVYLHPSRSVQQCHCWIKPYIYFPSVFLFQDKGLHSVRFWGGKESQAPLLVPLTPHKPRRRPSLLWSSLWAQGPIK